MFCTKCGHKNEQGAAFCVNCGNALEMAGTPPMPQGQPVPPAPAYTPPSAAGMYGAPPIKKSRKGLMIGLIAGGVVLIAAAVVLVLLLMGGSNIVGEWYNSDRDETLEFYDDGTIEITSPYADYEGEYEYNKSKGEGVITIEGEDYDFEVDKDEIDVDDVGVYVKDADADEKSNEIVGQWYNEELDETMEFKNNGNIEIETPYEDYEGEYEYNQSKGEGVITIDGDDYDFVFDGNEIDVEDIGVYQKQSGGDNSLDFNNGSDAAFGGNSSGVQSGLLGVWYSANGEEGVLEFYANGTYDAEIMGITLSGTYTFDPSLGEGEIVAEMMGETNVSDFYLENGMLDIDGSEYTREYVEQLNMEDFLENFEDIE